MTVNKQAIESALKYCWDNTECDAKEYLTSTNNNGEFENLIGFDLATWDTTQEENEKICDIIENEF